MQEKTCSKCGETKDVSEFGRDKRSGDGLQSWCRVCKRLDYKSNRAKRLEQMNDWKRSNKGKVAGYKRKYKRTEAGRECVRRYNSARRSRKTGAAGIYDFRVALEVYGHRCALCGDTESKLTVGHIIPLSQGGSNWQWNIRPECTSCNCSKGAERDEELPQEWWDARPDGSEWPTQQV